MRILGIDPAWTKKHSSGIALVEELGKKWICSDVAPSFDSFCSPAGISERFLQKEKSNYTFNLKEILDKCGPVDCIVVDMPISSKPFNGRRAADDAIAKEFGKAWCATHTPTKNVSLFSVSFLSAAKDCGYIFNENIIETYPHPAILTLIPDLEKRLPYKVGKRNTYWPNDSPNKRRAELFKNLQSLRNALGHIIVLPDSYNIDKDASFVLWKKFEDTLDALVCAWVGIEFMRGRCIPFGDDSSKIWIPAK